LQASLNQFEVSIFPFDNPKILKASKDLATPEKNSVWYISQIKPGEDYTATLATSEKHNEISLLDWENI
jgi:hypothetical protein